MALEAALEAGRLLLLLFFFLRFQIRIFHDTVRERGGGGAAKRKREEGEWSTRPLLPWLAEGKKRGGATKRAF